MNPSDFGADIFDPEDDSTPRGAAADAPAPTAKKKRTRKPKRATTPADATVPADESEVAPENAAASGEARWTEAEPIAAPDAAAGLAEVPEWAPDGPADGDDSSPTDAVEPGSEAAGDDEDGPRRKRSRRRRRRRGGRDGDETGGAERDGDSPDAAAGDDAASFRGDAFESPEPESPEFDSPESDARDTDDADFSADDSDDGAESGDVDAESDQERGDEREDFGDERGRRRRRRRRRGGRRDEIEATGTEPTEGEERPAPAPRNFRRSDRMIDVPTPDGEVRGMRIGVLIDLAALLDDASQTDGEVAFGKLLQRVARHRHLIRAIAYAPDDMLETLGSTLRGSGVETRRLARTTDLPVALAVDAMALAARVDCVVLIPGASQLEPLTSALRAQGIRTESAGFTTRDATADDQVQSHHLLGAESLFVP